jgi:CDGSH-type Zn-finger protein
MAICKCGVSKQYPECDSTHKKIIENEKLRKAILDAFEKYENEEN